MGMLGVIRRDAGPIEDAWCNKEDADSIMGDAGPVDEDASSGLGGSELVGVSSAPVWEHAG